MNRASRFHPGPAVLPGVVLALTLCAGLLVPVYTDEVAWRFQLSRLVQDGWLDRGLGESCGPGTSLAPPLFMWPVRLFSSAVTAAFPTPLAVRVAGVLGALAMAVLLALLTRRLTRIGGRGAAMAVTTLPFALLGLGVLPFLLVWSRPEQPVLLALLAALLVGLAPPPTRGECVGRLALVVALAGVAFSYQFKAIFYLPLFAWALVMAGRGAGRWSGRALALAVMMVLAVLAWRYWTARFACPDDPIVTVRMAHENAGATLIHAGWRERIAAVDGLIRNMDPTRYVRPTRPSGRFMSDWLPPSTLARGPLKLWTLAVWGGWVAGWLVGGVALAVAIADPRRRRGPHAPLMVLALLCVACPSAWALLQTNVNAYEAALYLPVLTIGIVAALVAAAPSPGSARVAGAVALGIALLSVASQAMLVATVAPTLWRAERSGGYVAGQPYSVSALAFAATRRRIVAAGRLCGIPDRPAPARLLIDDLTYFAYSAGTRPMHRLGVVSDWNGSIRDQLGWMHAHGASGAVIRCAYLTPAMRARARALGAFCCVGPQ